MAVAEKALKAFDPAKLVVWHTDYAGKTFPEARKAIVKLLENHSIVITSEVMDKDRIKGLLGKDENGVDREIPDYMQSSGQMEGIALVRVFYDGTSNTGKIKSGKPVVMDTIKGNAVTGINESWEPDEYKIAGIALEDFETLNVEDQRIQIRLSPPAAIAAEDAAIFVTKAKPGQSYPPYVANSGRRVFPAVKIINPTWTGDGSVGIAGAEDTEPHDLFQVAVNARHTLAGTKVVGWSVNGKWYFEYLPPPMVTCILQTDMNLGGMPSYAEVHTVLPPVLAPGEKVKLMGFTRPGYKYAAGSTIVAALVGTEYCLIKTYNCPIPQ